MIRKSINVLVLMFFIVSCNSSKIKNNKPVIQQDKKHCQLPKIQGQCKGYFKRYYYNSKKEKCEEFFYGGCQGNKNNFRTLDECQKSCEK